MALKKGYQQDMHDWYGLMVEAGKQLSKKDAADLSKWENENLDGQTVATSDWPRWQEFGLPPKPTPSGIKPQ